MVPANGVGLTVNDLEAALGKAATLSGGRDGAFLAHDANRAGVTAQTETSTAPRKGVAVAPALARGPLTTAPARARDLPPSRYLPTPYKENKSIPTSHAYSSATTDPSGRPRPHSKRGQTHRIGIRKISGQYSAYTYDAKSRLIMDVTTGANTHTDNPLTLRHTCQGASH